jgi:uncharacterized damage-inducible protein DinB
MTMGPIPRLALLVLALAPLPTAARGQTPEGFREEFLRQFDASMGKFEALARAMPESAYTWSPAEGVMSVSRVYGHVARYNYYYPAEALGVELPAGVSMDGMERLTSKAELVGLLRRSGDHVRAVVAEGTQADWAESTRLYGRDVPRWSVLLQLLAHMNEHLGQSIAYARSNGVVPPWSQ